MVSTMTTLGWRFGGDSAQEPWGAHRTPAPFPEESPQAEAGSPGVTVLLWGHPRFSVGTGSFITPVRALGPGPEWARNGCFSRTCCGGTRGDTGRGEAEGSSVTEVQPGPSSLGASLALGESCLLSAVAAASSRSVLVNNSVSHPFEPRV